MLTRKFIRGAGLALLGAAGAITTSRSATADKPEAQRAPTPADADALVEQHVLEFEQGVPPNAVYVTEDLPITARSHEPEQCFAHAARAMTKDFAPMALDPDAFAVAAKLALRDVERRGLEASPEERSELLWAYGEQLLDLVDPAVSEAP